MYTTLIFLDCISCLNSASRPGQTSGTLLSSVSYGAGRASTRNLSLHLVPAAGSSGSPMKTISMSLDCPAGTNAAVGRTQYSFGAVVFTLKAIAWSELFVMVMWSVDSLTSGAWNSRVSGVMFICDMETCK